MGKKRSFEEWFLRNVLRTVVSHDIFHGFHISHFSLVTPEDFSSGSQIIRVVQTQLLDQYWIATPVVNFFMERNVVGGPISWFGIEEREGWDWEEDRSSSDVRVSLFFTNILVMILTCVTKQRDPGLPGASSRSHAVLGPCLLLGHLWPTSRLPSRHKLLDLA